MEDAVAELAGYSLLKWDHGLGSFRIHRLVQKFTQDQVPPDQREGCIRAALNLINDALPVDPPSYEVRSWPTWVPLRRHVFTIVRTADAIGIAEPTTRLMNGLGLLLKERCVWSEAEALYRRAFAIDEASLWRNASQCCHSYQQPGAIAASHQSPRRGRTADAMRRGNWVAFHATNGTRASESCRRNEKLPSNARGYNEGLHLRASLRPSARFSAQYDGSTGARG